MLEGWGHWRSRWGDVAYLRLHLYLLHSPAGLRPSVRLFSSCGARGALTSPASTLRQQPSYSLGASPPSQPQAAGAASRRLRLPAAPPTCVPTLRLPSGLTFWVACCVYSCSPNRSRSKKIKIKTSFSVVWDANQLTSLGFPAVISFDLSKLKIKKKFLPNMLLFIHFSEPILFSCFPRSPSQSYKPCNRSLFPFHCIPVLQIFYCYFNYFTCIPICVYFIIVGFIRLLWRGGCVHNFLK